MQCLECIRVESAGIGVFRRTGVETPLDHRWRDRQTLCGPV
jgi:hypothetical protein